MYTNATLDRIVPKPPTHVMAIQGGPSGFIEMKRKSKLVDHITFEFHECSVSPRKNFECARFAIDRIFFVLRPRVVYRTKQKM